MKKSRFLTTFFLILLLSLVVVGVAGAQDEDELTCEAVAEAGSVEGTVIAVDDEAGTVDVLLEDGSCVTVTLAEGDYDHPVVALLADYFGGASLEDYEDALDALDTEDGTVVSIEEGEEEGTWVVTYSDDTTAEIDDEELAEELTDALDALAVDLEVTENEDGDLAVADAGDQIEEYHEDGIGFGVLVKVYAIAAESQEACEADEEEDGEGDGDAEATAEPTSEATSEPTAEPTGEPGEDDGEEELCGVTVEELIAMLESGYSLGDLFALYGKPALLGVGHVRQGEASTTDTDGDGDVDAGDAKVLVCHDGNTISVSASAVPSHTAHGDSVGSCDDNGGGGDGDGGKGNGKNK